MPKKCAWCKDELSPQDQHRTYCEVACSYESNKHKGMVDRAKTRSEKINNLEKKLSKVSELIGKTNASTKQGRSTLDECYNEIVELSRKIVILKRHEKKAIEYFENKKETRG